MKYVAIALFGFFTALCLYQIVHGSKAMAGLDGALAALWGYFAYRFKC